MIQDTFESSIWNVFDLKVCRKQYSACHILSEEMNQKTQSLGFQVYDYLMNAALSDTEKAPEC